MTYLEKRGFVNKHLNNRFSCVAENLSNFFKTKSDITP